MPEALLHGSRHQTRHKLSLRYYIMRLRFEDRCGEILTCGKTWPLTSPPGWYQVDKQTLSYSWKRHRVHLWHELKSRRVSLICGTLSCGPQVPLSFLCIFTELGGGAGSGGGGKASLWRFFFNNCTLAGGPSISNEISCPSENCLLPDRLTTSFSYSGLFRSR